MRNYEGSNMDTDVGVLINTVHLISLCILASLVLSNSANHFLICNTIDFLKKNLIIICILHLVFS